MSWTIRPVDRARDRAAIGEIDTGFETEIVLDVVATPSRIELVERRLAAPRTKRYSMDEAFAAWSSWDVGWVALEGDAAIGFAGVEYEPWHARLVLWHLYVTRTRRRAGVGRALIAEIEAHGRRLGARSVWLETTSVNVPGIAAYRALGYRLVGGDTTAYDTLPYADEAALYLARRLD